MSARIDTSGVNLDLFGQRTLAAVKMYSQTKAQQLQDTAKQNRPWTDRTNMARQSLKGIEESTDKGERITLAHGVEYGVWLELAHEKRFAILEPTIMEESPKIVQGLNNLLSSIKEGR